MEPRRIIIALVFAVALSGAATYFLYSKLRSQAASHPQSKAVVVTKQALEAGVVLKDEDLTTIDYPVSLAPEGSFSKIDAEVLGHSLIYPLGIKEPVLKRELADPGSGIGLTIKIPTGMRATAVRANEIVGVGGFLYPGSHVDVLCTIHPPGSASTLTQTILQNVEVLTSGPRTQADAQGKQEIVNVVTLLLSPEDSEKINLATSLGTIQFVLRNGADLAKANIKPASLEGLVSGTEKPLASAKTKRAKAVVAQATPKPPDFYTVEVIQGEKRSVEKFE